MAGLPQYSADVAIQDQVRTAEVVACLSLATDLAMGLPREHGLGSAVIATRLADILGVDSDTASQAYYGSSLYYIGCTADAEISAELFPWGTMLREFNPAIYGGPAEVVRGIVRSIAEPNASRLTRTSQVVRTLPRAVRGHPAHMTAMCEVARMLGERVGLPPAISGLFTHLTERWDGKGSMNGLKGEAIPLALRIVSVARDASIQVWIGGLDHAVDVIRERGGRGHDPEIAEAFCAHAEGLVPRDEASVWEVALASEPGQELLLRDDAIDEALAAIGDFADLAVPCLAGHSAGVARLTQRAASSMGFDAQAEREVTRAAYVHDLGRVAVSPAVWNKPGPLTSEEREQVRLHAYQTERVLASSPFLAGVGRTASAHHERCDGSGYHRGVDVTALSPAARLLAAADTYHTMLEARPHRPARAPAEAAEDLIRQSREGLLDAGAVRAVLDASGQGAAHPVHPGGLTDREVQVLDLLAHGLQIKQIARKLGIAPKTASRHVQNIYPKIGVSTRAAAAVYAMQHGVSGWGERPIADDPRNS